MSELGTNLCMGRLSAVRSSLFYDFTGTPSEKLYIRLYDEFLLTRPFKAVQDELAEGDEWNPAIS